MTAPDRSRVVYLAEEDFAEPPPPFRSGAAGIVRMGQDGALEQETRLLARPYRPHALQRSVGTGTNHLDLATKEMLIKTLADFDGTMLFVSHDRTFLRGMANRVLDLSGGGEGVAPEPLVYPGTYEEWVERTGHEAPGVWH